MDLQKRIKNYQLNFSETICQNVMLCSEKLHQQFYHKLIIIFGGYPSSLEYFSSHPSPSVILCHIFAYTLTPICIAQLMNSPSFKYCQTPCTRIFRIFFHSFKSKPSLCLPFTAQIKNYETYNRSARVRD